MSMRDLGLVMRGEFSSSACPARRLHKTSAAFRLVRPNVQLKRLGGASSTALAGLPRTATIRRNSTLRCTAAATAGNTGAANDFMGGHGTSSGSTATLKPSNAPTKAAQRAARLETALILRRLYRNLLRAEPLLQLSSPVYTPPAERPALDPETAMTADVAADAAAATEAQARIDEAVALVAEIELTAEEIRLGIRALKAAPHRFGALLSQGGGDPSVPEAQIEARVKEVYAALVERAARELPLLPFSSTAAAQAAIDARNARYRAPVPPPPFAALDGGASDVEGAPEGAYLGPDARRGLGERLEEAERFVARRLQPAVARVRDEVSTPEGFIVGVQRSASWARGLWDRLNGSTRSGSTAAPEGLPLPQSSEPSRASAVEALHGEIEELEAKLQEASKARETRLRKAGIQGRARLASELRQMDNEVAAVSRALAVRTLQLEMEFIYGCLEEEAYDVVGDPSAMNGAGADERLALALGRRGSTEEVALLAAEFRQLDADLANLAAEVEGGGALFVDDAILAALATEIPDLRMRLGVGDTTVFGGTGISLGKVQMQLRQAIAKVLEGISFGVRGVRLLGSDVAAAGRLFWRALIGGTLKPREVAALRRTARDLLTFIPFIIILITPLTPVGHVLIFGFIQRYFPGFFPSQFTSRRQDLMIKYEELKQQLQTAQLLLEQENDQLEFEKAAAALAAQTRAGLLAGDAVALASASAGDAGAATETAGAGSGGGNGAGGKNNGNGRGGNSATSRNGAVATGEDEEREGPAAKAVRKLEEELAAAADSSYTDVDAE